ncbi:retinol dehydrogenase 12-like [Oppia nitens]|uniref:retinol dehydrogenase 12-like n=1 Tax=Oppia nitens TaxID=1686743 RepID=UPI0023DBE831|nr:retinol dehydrogenase 12-like [Oppia nitens]
MANLIRLGISGYFEYLRLLFRLSKRCQSQRQLTGDVAVVTGANTGIGKETAYQLSLRGATVIIGCRNIEKGEDAVNDIKGRNESADIILLKLDLASLKSVRQFAQNVAQQVRKVDIIVNNAGVMMCPEWKTTDGFEMQFGTNYLGHFLLTMHLLPLLKKSVSARVINISSLAHMIGRINFENINMVNGSYQPFKAYAQSKLALILFGRELARRLGSESKIKTYSVHPGHTFSELGRYDDMVGMIYKLGKIVFLNPEMGSQTTLFCALDETLDNETGFYYVNCARVNGMVSAAKDDISGEKLWDLSCDLVNLEPHLRIYTAKSSAWQETDK